jgi:dTDP-4-amino-4,6-dideoxy-D-galactose acyltransferase
MGHHESSACEVLDWDSAFFGFRIARLREARLTALTVTDSLEWAYREKIRCLYFLTACHAYETMDLAGANGFRIADVRVTLARELKTDPGSTESVRAFDESDLPAIQTIAAGSHRDSRFYNDPGFPEERCEQLYRTWIERSCHGYADKVLVAEYQQRPAGYVSCHLHSDGTAAIGLLAVADWARGIGLGGQLVTGALHFFARAGSKRVTVVTQGRNCAAQRLYQNCGFRSASMELWYHRWFNQVAS